MNRQEKSVVIESLKNTFNDCQASFLVGYRGLTVAQMQDLRRQLRAQGGTVKVTKARLMKCAAEGLDGVQELAPYFKDQVALVFATKEVAPVAKVLVEFSKQHAALNVVVGSTDKAILDARGITFLASLPSREILLAQLCGVLMAPVASLARVVNSIKEQKEQSVQA